MDIEVTSTLGSLGNTEEATSKSATAINLQRVKQVLRSLLNEKKEDERPDPLSRMKQMRRWVHQKYAPWRQGAKCIHDGFSVLETSREDKPLHDMCHCQIEEVADIRKTYQWLDKSDRRRGSTTSGNIQGAASAEKPLRQSSTQQQGVRC